MRKLFVLVFLLGCAGVAGAALSTHGSVGVGHGIALPHGRSNPCGGTLLLNYDGSAENAFCWQYGGVVAPQYGAFAECYDMVGGICGVGLCLTSTGNPPQPATLFIWADAGGIPGTVLSQTNVTPTGVPLWPSIGQFDYPISAMVAGNFWVGYWSNFANQLCGYYVAADLNGFGGCPMTNIAPGIGYPTGWNNCSVVWGPVQSIGIGAWMDCAPNVRCGPPPGPFPCCFSDGTCQLVYDCPGVWVPGTTCDPSPCATNTSAVSRAGDAAMRSIVAFPNPSTGQVLILYGVPQASGVTLRIFDASGTEVRALAQGARTAGVHQVRWDGRNDAGETVPSGTYFARCETASGTITGKIVLAR